MRATKTLRWCMAASLSLVFAVGVTIAQAPKPKRINRAIELLAQGQPIYYTGLALGNGRHLRTGCEGRSDVCRLPQLRHGARAVRHQRPRRLHARAGGRRSDQERPSHAGGDRQRAGERDRRSDGARQCVDVPSGAGHRRARHHADACRHARRRAGAGGIGAAPHSQTGRRRGHQ